MYRCVHVCVCACCGEGTDMESLRSGRLEEARDYSKEAVVQSKANGR